ncbi:D-sedoheptulose-7-phosphate isomerase [Roseospirillum parvum]|uniref:D-sedoheptulose 7-phosphate isomerase n=1 Tax=Roseospirillum parvum TaxID=83401 RepID=A0A1G7ZKE9_9PROT|nr:SIS domain-containing protein [Roseospirillum parvum]SDH09057.1 D-sedoheptulose 7-phosphate isomerase [Roseospirillum parvum]
MSTLDQAFAAAAQLLTRCREDGALLAAMEKAHALCNVALGQRLPVLVCGNGGSMADALHLAGELTARFRRDRQGLPVIALGANPATLTAWSNDVGYASALAREVEAYGRPGGVVIGLSTSGNSANVVAAFEAARAGGLATVALTGEGGGRLASLADVLLAVPARDTAAIQQVHLVLYHVLCDRLEADLAGG